MLSAPLQLPMIEARAVVVRADGNRALLKIEQRPGGCGRCHEPGGCQSVQLTQAFGTIRETFYLPNTLGVRAGDAVRIVMDERASLYAALLSYGLAACLLLAGAAAGTLSGGGDGSALVGGMAGLGLAVMVNRLIYRSRSWRNRLKMRMQRDHALCALETESSP